MAEIDTTPETTDSLVESGTETATTPSTESGGEPQQGSDDGTKGGREEER